MSEVSPISSSCKLCLFAIYDGDTQIGCEFNRTEKVKNNKVYELIEATDNEKNFYVLNNHICPYQRTSHWIHADSDNKKAMAEKEVYMRWSAILIAHKENLDLIEQRLKEIQSQSVRPAVITLVLDQCENVEKIFKLMDKYTDIWYLHNNLYEDAPDRFIIDCCFEKMKRHKFLFYSVFELDKPINPQFYQRIHNYVIENMNQYGVIKNENSLHEMIVSKLIHTKYAGNANGVDLEEKIIYDNKDLQQDDLREKDGFKTNNMHFVIDYKEI